MKSKRATQECHEPGSFSSQILDPNEDLTSSTNLTTRQPSKQTSPKSSRDPLHTSRLHHHHVAKHTSSHDRRVALAPDGLQLIPLQSNPANLFMAMPAAGYQDMDLLLIHSHSLVKMAARMADDVKSIGLARLAVGVGGSFVAFLPVAHMVVCDSSVSEYMLVELVWM
jgi:hypothetical protein